MRLYRCVLPPNAGHMDAVYDAACPAVANWVRRCLGGPGESADWAVTGGGVRLARKNSSADRSVREGGLTAASATFVGGKSVNQDAVGRLVAPGPGREAAVVCVADGVTSSPYSEFGAAVAVATGLRAGRDWAAAPSETPLPERLLAGLERCRAALRNVRSRIRTALEEMVALAPPKDSPHAVEEAYRQLALLDSGYGEALSTTLLVLAANREAVAGTAIGNGGFYNVRDDRVAPIWWTSAEQPLEQYVGADTLPDSVTYAFERPWEGAGREIAGAATDGVGAFEGFEDIRLAARENVPLDRLLRKIQKRLRERGVDLDLLDNSSLAEIGGGRAEGGAR